MSEESLYKRINRLALLCIGPKPIIIEKKDAQFHRENSKLIHDRMKAISDSHKEEKQLWKDAIMNILLSGRYSMDAVKIANQVVACAKKNGYLEILEENSND